MKEATRILIVEDKSVDAELAKHTLEKALKACEFQVVETRKDFLNALDVFQPDVILSDYSLPRFDGMKALKLTLEHAPLIPFIIWTGSISEDVAVECMKAGANNYVLKDNNKRLVPSVLHALEERQLLIEVTQTEEKYQKIIENSLEGIFQSTPQGRYLNVNPAMARIYGYDSPKEMIQSVKSIADQIYVEPLRREEFIKLLNSENIVENYEERNYRKDGTIIWTSTSARAVHDPQGNILYYEGFIQDITQRKKAEETLQNNEKRFRALIENGLDDISLLAVDGTLLWESPSIVRNLGYPPDTFVGRNIFELMHPEDQEWTQKRFQKLVQEIGGREQGIFRLQRSNGTWRWVEAIVTNMLNDPSVNAIVINYRDITERIQTEESLRESQAKYQNLVEASHDLIWSVDAEGKITFLNHAAKEIYGYEPEELIGRSYFEIMDPEHYGPKNFERFKENIADSDSFREVETYVRHRNGKKTILSANSIVVRDNEGNVIGVTGSSHDITIRKRVEEVLKEERNLLRTLIDNIPDRIYAMDLQGKKTLSNTADWKACGGKTMEDIIGKTDFEIYPPELAEGFWQLDKAVLESGERVINVEEPGLDFEGNLVSILTTKIPLRDEKGKVIGLVGVGRDITERKQAEESLRLFRSLIDQTNDSIEIIDPESRHFLDVNERACREHGYTHEEYLSLAVAEIDPTMDVQAWQTLIEKLEFSGSYTFESLHRRKDGSIFPVEVNLNHIHLDRDYYLTVVRDITERKQAEEALRQSEARYRTLVETQTEFIVRWKPDGTRTFANKAYCNYFGLTPEQAISDSFIPLILEEDRPAVEEKIHRLVTGVTSVEAETHRVVQPDGQIGWQEWIDQVVRNNHGELIEIQSVGRDITERKQAEEKLRQSENRYRLVTKATNDVIWEWNPTASQLLWSENAQHVFGYPPEEIGPQEKWWDDHIHPADRLRVLPKLAALINGNESLWQEEYRFLLRDGSYAHISDRAYIERDESGAPIRMIGAMSNITSRKEAEIERQAVLEIMQGLANTSDVQELLELIHHSIAKVIYARNFFVALYNEENGLFEEIYSVDQYDPPPQPFELEKSITSYVFRTGEPLLLTQERFDELVEQGEVMLVGTNSASWLGVPLKTSGKTIGVIAVQDYENDHRYSERDKEFLFSIASQVALAIERKQADIELQQKNDDLGLLHAVNEAIVEGQNLDSIIALMANELSRIFSVQGSTVYSTLYLLTSDKQFIRIQNQFFSSEITNKIEKLIGFRLPMIEIPIKKGSYFYQAMTCRQSAMVADPQGIRAWITEFTETKFLAALAKTAVRKLVPKIQKLLNINSMILVPLISEEETIGFLSVSGSGRFTAQDQKRIENIAGQLTAVIQWQQAEQDQRTSNERFNLISKAVNDAVWDWDITTDQVRWNDAIHALFKYEPANVGTDSKWWINCIHPEDRERILSGIQNVIDSRTANNWKNEYRFKRADGSYAFVFDRGYIIRDASKKALRMVGAIQDITERKQAEEALHKSEALYRQAMEVAGAVPYYESYYDEGRLIKYEFIGEGIRQITGYGPEEFTAKLWDTLVEEVNLIEDLSGYSLDEGIERVRSGESPIWKCEHRLRDRDGNIHWVFEAAVELRDENGVSHGSIGTYQDITTRKQAEEAEREQRALAEALRDTAETLSSTLDYGEVLDQILVAVGRVVPHDAATIMLIDGECARVVRTSGYDKRGFNAEIMGIELPLTETPNLQQMLETGQPVVVHDTYSYPGWKRLEVTDWLRSNVGAPISIQGQVIGFILLDSQALGFFSPVQAERLEAFANQAAIAIHNAHLLQQAQEEIAERKRAETALMESTAQFHALFEASPDAILLIDPQTWSIIDCNTAACQMNGYEREELIGQCIELINVLPENLAERIAYMEKIQQQGVLHYETSHRHKNGIVFPVDVSTSLIKVGARDLILGIDRNITERKRAEQEIRRRAEETSALLETSLALTNLDLNATLQTIGNSAKTLFVADGCRIFLMEPDGQALRCVLALQENFTVFSNVRVKIGEGVTGMVAATGQAEIVNEMQNDLRALQIPGTPQKEEEAIMFAPLKERDHTIGVLSIRRAGAERPFQSAELELLEAFASMAASAVSNARLFEETQRRLVELEALYENGLAVGQLLTNDEIGNRMIETFARYLEWHHVTIRLRREESDDLDLVAFSLPDLMEEEKVAIEQHFIALINKVGQGLSGWAIQTGLPCRTGNVHSHPQYIDTYAGTQSGLYMPLKMGERVIGVISVESQIPDAFTEQDERLLATLANQAAIAFENARLYATIQKELSERKRAEQALRASEVHYRQLADSITDILFELDQDLHYTHWNKASETLTGVSAKDAIGKSMHEIFGDSQEQIRIGQIYDEVLKSRQPRTFETTLFINEQNRSFEINAYPSTRGVSVVAKDVTERKRSEIIMQKRFELMEFSAHHSLEELMQKTIDEVSELTGSSIGFLHFVEEDQITLGMQTWSTNALQLFHVPYSEGEHLSLDQAGVWAEAARQRRPLIQNNYEALSKRRGLPQGHEPIKRELVIPIIRNERIMAIIGMANKPQDYTSYDLEIAARLADYAWDVTERKQMETALEAERNQLAQRVDERTADLSRANSNLARALRVKDEFLANMSHELRTPLNAILGLSESLSEQIAGPLNEKQQKYISTISESGHHLLSLINDILDLAKIDAGQITLDINKVDVHSVCQASLRMIKQLAQKKNQEVSLEIDEGLGLVWADERRLKQMLVNLLGNAVKFTPENGKLGLEVHADEEANKISFTVWDNGVGIREEDLARLFQPFVQLDSGLARETTGTGLGLALVAQMARLHGGSIAAVSEPEQGSRFTVVLPWEPALAMDAATRMKITGKFRAIKLEEKNKPVILVVEDTQEVTMMVKDYLELAGYRVVTAQDGVDALVQAKLVRPDLILMDVQMPRMDGLEATRKLRSEPDFRYTPIIALTAMAMSGDRERCLEAGMDEYISKPVNLKALIKIMQDCLFNNQEAKSQ